MNTCIKNFGTLSTFGITEHIAEKDVKPFDFGTLSTFGITEQIKGFRVHC